MQTVRVQIKHAGSVLESKPEAMTDARVDEWIRKYLASWRGLIIDVDSGWFTRDGLSRRQIAFVANPGEAPFVFHFTRKTV